ncbi:DUF488 family protein [Microaerobacter geothermalis]|uniref:DUF488 family protein, N3 subclade n=1 Tax=Microaerobacter geothermalis TaxID=674972 RepID=UPI001F170C29|nr:DUF488 family protein [Microaerobacter geothermalis]MCF6094307.1 DUF488 family protein [Microaerobacter geothermalis]
MAGSLFLYNVYKDPPNQDVNLLITRTQKTLPGWIHVPELAPDPALYNDFLRWQWEKLWPRKKWNEYKERYIQGLKNPSTERYLKGLLKRLMEGKNVAVGCYCHDEDYCHKLLVGDWISAFGIEIIHGRDIRPKREARAIVPDGQLSIFDAFEGRNYG